MEVEWFARTLDQYGLWRSLAAASHREKIKLIQEKYQSEIHGILLGLLESHDIGDRVRRLLEDTRSDDSYLEVIATVFVLATLGTPATIETLADLWGLDLISSSRFRNHPTVRQLLDFNSYDAKVKSSVVAQFVLKSAIGWNLIPILLKLATHASKAARGVPRYMNLLTEMLRYSNLQRIIPEVGRREAAIRYYEGVKTLPQTQRNPLFWLQYAIACLVEGDIGRAKIYFDTAYSFASKSEWFDTYQIDNHFARFLLVEATDTNMPIAKAIENFRLARSIINRQFLRDRLHYPYRVATSYQDFIDRFGSQFTVSICAEVKAAADQVLERAGNLPDEMKHQPKVRRCCEAMRYVVHRCTEISDRI